MHRSAVLLAGIVIGAIACTSSPEPESRGSASTARTTQASAPDVASVVCGGSGTRVLTPVVALSADGVHFSISNATDRTLTFMPSHVQGRDTTPGEFATHGDNSVRPGTKAMVWLLPPGITSVACIPKGTVRPVSSSGMALLRLVDPDGLYVPVPRNVECRGGESKSYGLNVPLGFGGRTDPLQAVRERLAGLRPGDRLERTGYPEEAYPSVLVSRDGRVVALVDVGPAVSSDSSVVSACLDSGIRPNYARTPSEPSGMPSPVPLEQFPHQVEIVEGGTDLVLYLAIAERGSAELDDAVSRARSYGYAPEVRRLGCDVGAAEKYRLPKDWIAVGVYFNRERDPWFVADAINSPHWEPSQVTTRCVD